MRINRKAGTALIAALILVMHNVVLCAAGVPNCISSSVSSIHHQEQGCHDHLHHDSRKSQGCVCCESLLCAPRAEVARADGRLTSDRIAAFVPVWFAPLLLNPAGIGARLSRVSESAPSHTRVRTFLVQKMLLL